MDRLRQGAGGAHFLGGFRAVDMQAGERLAQAQQQRDDAGAALQSGGEMLVRLLRHEGFDATGSNSGTPKTTADALAAQ